MLSAFREMNALTFNDEGQGEEAIRGFGFFPASLLEK